jgi:hypothetical protein
MLFGLIWRSRATLNGFFNAAINVLAHQIVDIIACGEENDLLELVRTEGLSDFLKRHIEYGIANPLNSLTFARMPH